MAAESKDNSQKFPRQRLHSEASSSWILQKILQESAAADVSFLSIGSGLRLHDKDGPVVQSSADAFW